MTGPDLQEALDELNMTQRHLANRLGYDTNTVSLWCTDKSPVPKHVKEYVRVLRLVMKILDPVLSIRFP